MSKSPKGSTPDKKADAAPKGERIAKRIARAGLCSRREAERWIEDGRVAVNGKVLDSPAVVLTGGEKVTVDGKALPEAEEPRLWRYHKPTGLVTSHSDEKGRDTVFDKLPDDMPRVISVGRLDINSEGLLLLTNDGEISRRLELPSTGWLRRYRVRVYGRPQEDALAKLKDGITIDGVRYSGILATLDSQKGANAWLTVALREGKNREIRLVMEHLGYQVTRLIRISYGPFKLGDIKPGEVEEVPRKIIRDQVLAGSKEKKIGTATAKEKSPSRRPGKADTRGKGGAKFGKGGDKSLASRKGPMT